MRRLSLLFVLAACDGKTATDDSTPIDPNTDDSAADDSTADDSVIDDSAADDSATDDSAADDTATDDTATDDTATDDTATDDSGLVDADGDGADASVDCDDANPNAYPGNDEVCDDVDNNCDGQIDEDTAVDAPTWYPDVDGDGYGDPSTGLASCDQPSGMIGDGNDCDDADDSVYPGATPLCDGKDTDCSGSVEELVVPTDYATITDAIDHSVDGDWICVAAGTYAEDLSFPTWNIRLESMEGSGATLVEGTGSARVLTIGAGTAQELYGFTFSGGDGGVEVQDATLTMEDVVAGDNVSTGCWGGGLNLVNSAVQMDAVVLRDNSFSGCTTGAGAGMNISGGSVISTDLLLYGNDCTAENCAGGTLLLDGGTHTLLNTEISDNTATTTGQITGLVDLRAGNVTVENLIVAGNVATGDGSSSLTYGSLIIFLADGLRLSNASIVGNQQNDFGTYGAGTGLTVHTSENITIVNVDVSANTNQGASVDGGSVTVYGTTPNLSYSNVYGNDDANPWSPSTLSSLTGNVEVDPDYTSTNGRNARNWNLNLHPHSLLIDAGDPSILDPDASRSDVGAYGGPGGGW